MLKVAVLMGGRSGEHRVSLQSARFIIRSLEQSGHRVVPVGITNEGRWLHHHDILCMLSEGGDLAAAKPVQLDLDYQGRGLLCEGESLAVDLVFPVLHGPFGEDGTVQGALEVAGLPYVGAGVLGSALAMDKVQMKAAFSHHQLPVGSYIAFTSWQWQEERRELMARMQNRLGLPLFVKPANLGSSVGITKAKNPPEIIAAVELALKYDSKIIVEAAVAGREIECSVLGTEYPRASLPGEIIAGKEFYDYEAKYIDESSRLIIPAPLDEELTKRIQQLALAAFKAVDCMGLARVDMFLKADGTVLLNEINTMPGFTAISMFPKLWEKSGLDGPALVNKLVELGLSIHRQRRSRQHSLELGEG